MEPILTLRGVSRRYPNGRGLLPVDLSLEPGTILGLLGANGAGKSTLMKLVAGLQTPDSGEILFCGKPCGTDTSLRMHTGFMIEQPEAYDYLTAWGNLEQKAAFYPNSRQEVETALQRVGLWEYRNERTKGFSLGMKQRLGLAMALVGHPSLLVLDEPTNGLDIEGRSDFRNLLLQLREEDGVAMLVSSHLVHELSHVVDRAVVLHEGKMVGMLDTVEDIRGDRVLEERYLELIHTARSA